MLTRQSDPPNPTLGWQPHFAGIMALLDMAQVSLRHIHTKYNEGRLTDSAMAQRDLSADPSRSHQTRGGRRHPRLPSTVIHRDSPYETQRGGA